MLKTSRNFHLFFLLILLFSFPSFAQVQVETASSIITQDTALARQLFEEAWELSNMDQQHAAIENTRQARGIYERTSNWELLIKCYHFEARCFDYLENLPQSRRILNEADSVARLYLTPEHYLNGTTFQQKAELFVQTSELDSAMAYFTKGILIFKRHQKYESLAWCTLLAGLVGYYQHDFDRMEDFLNEAESLIKEQQLEDVAINETLFQYKNILYNFTGEFEKELQVAEELLAFRLSIKEPTTADSSMLAINYSMLGSAYFDRGDFNNAKHFYQLTIALQEMLEQDPVALACNYSNLGAAYHNELSYQDALYHFKKALQIFDQHDSGLEAIRGQYTATINTARIYTQLEKYDSAQIYLAQAKQISDREDIDFNKTHYFMCSGIIEYKIGQTEKAKHSLNRALQENIRLHGKVLVSGNGVFKHMGNIYLEQDSLYKALECYQQGLGLKGEAIQDVFVNPDMEQIADQLGAIPILLSKSKALERIGGDQYTKSAYQSCQLAIDLIDKMRQEYETEGSRQLLSTKAFAVYEQTIKLALQLYQKSQNISYLEQAFQYSEKSKALLILEALIIQAEANQQSVFSVSEELRQKEKSVKAQLIFYERKVFEEEEKGENGDKVKLDNWQRNLTELRNQYEQLRFQIKKEAPDYFNLKYDLQLASPQSIRQHYLSLPGHEQTAFIEYFMGEEHLYTFLITQDEFKLFSQPVEPHWVSAISQLQRLQSTNPFQYNNEQTAQKHFNQYIDNAQLIYQTLLAEVIPASANRLILIPDGILGYLSFDLLLTQTATPDKVDYSSQSLQYLIEDYQLSYAYSGSLLLESLELDKKEAPYLYGGFAPFNEATRNIALERNCTDGELAQLPNSETSVNTIHQLFGGQKFLGNAASRQAFIDQVANYQLLHLSTHACVDDNSPLFNRIYFADQALSTYELYRLQLNAALVVLSACETGTGRLVHGEGIMSLARGFMKSGCPSIITSLWNANDFSTSAIMIRFFELLKEGKSKDEALREAKLHYLNDAPPRLSSPYYWATFIHMGNNGPITFPSSFLWGWGGAALGLLLLVGVGRFWLGKTT